ncbi:lysophospholipase [Brachybacterium endophyticum]|uniref:Lysophospholipase n=1 Tax=Brachybacterium endophyticum TaxID=2182385 RepID=A0A2U2RPE4_9MICO|nr:alpha/beta fold hydrolase [Brachybacterium endophyticum]PWH07675.1 lysophospholipase [Brachybacterium endophyticum]
MRSVPELLGRTGQDDLLTLRNDLMTLQREVSADDRRLFPLRYARVNPPRMGRRAAGIRRDLETPVVTVVPDGPGGASVLPYDLLRRSLAARGLDVIMPEHRGVGLSRLDAEGHDLPPHAMDLDEAIEDLRAALDHALVERTVLYGCGYGAYLSLAFAARHPERVGALVLDSPLVGPGDEAISQLAVRERYWDGADPRTDTIARTLRRLDDQAVIDARRAGPVVLAVHEYGGTDDVRELVDLLAMGRGQATWTSVWQALTQEWLQSTRYVSEPDLVVRIAHTQLAFGSHADGGPMDPLLISGEQAQQAPAPTRRAMAQDLREVAPAITAPTLVLSGEQDLVTPPRIARELASLIPGAHLLNMPDTGHGILDSHSQLAQIAIWWSAAGAGGELIGQREQLMALKPTPSSRVLSHGLRLALAAERYSPWRMRLETARTRRAEALMDPSRRSARGPRL